MGADIWIWTTKAAPLITREGDQAQAQLSPDGRWLAYMSNETGRHEVFVAPFRFDETTDEATVGDSLPVSDGGVGTGNGLGGGIVAMIVGLLGMALGGLALARFRRLEL